jgi:murein L,D-transpeptidase YafK
MQIRPWRRLLGALIMSCLSTSVFAMSVLPGCSSAPHAVDTESRSSRFGFADKVLVKKGQRRLYLMRGGQPFRTYSVSLGTDPIGHKQRQGDNRTPEGRYIIDWRNPRSKFYRSLHISYPNERDVANARRRGWDPGGAIMIHGEPRGGRHADLRDLVRNEDWTEGCIAVSNLAIDEIWRYVVDGTPIEILP